MGQRQNTRLCLLTLVALCCLVLLHVKYFQPNTPKPSNIYPKPPRPHSSQDIFSHLALTDAQCRQTFPQLNSDLDAALSQGSFDLKYGKGAVLNGKIENGELYILHAPRKGELSSLMLQRQTASFNQLHRAIVTSPEPLPDIAFILAIHDIPTASSFSFARPAHPLAHDHTFPIPHFSFWSWPLPFIKSIHSAARAIAALEAQTPFLEKDPRAVWRGTPWFNNGAGPHPRVRQDLVAMAKGAGWADVQALDWEANGRDAKNALNIDDFCRYRYIIHTEGVGYSGRLQFHQLCESVVLSPPLEWMQHTSHLIKPTFSSTILNPEFSANYSSARTREAWAMDYPATEANMVFVSPDWSDLEATVQWLEQHPDIAAGIARRQRALYAENGYLSPAAEVCYWRALIRGWSKVAKPVGQEWHVEGMSFEEFVVVQKA
ncbi:hypothetical protein G7046_g8188 [Stylonectria norvegica]|nr:hypothetical protein G7046_g8188 [Stylonectria norvegica]